MKNLFLAAAALAICAPATALAAPNMAGAWKIAGAFPTMSVNYAATCTLKQDAAGHLAGTCVGDNGESDPATGAVTGNGFQVGYDTHYAGVAIHLAYQGVLQANGTVAGAVTSTPGPQGTFTAHR